MKTNKIVLLLILSIFFSSCFSDKGNYDYSEVKEILVTFTSSPYILSAGESVTVVPVLKYSVKVPGGDKLPLPEVEYEWSLDGKVVSTDPTYQYTAGDKIGRYTGYLKVRNIETGEQYAGSFNLSVESPYKTGFLILYEDAKGQGEFGFIRSIVNGMKIGDVNRDSLVFINEYAAIYEKANGFPMLKNAVAFSEHSASPGDSDAILTEITLYTENGTFIEDINGNSFARETKIQDEFVSGIIPDDFVPKKVVHTAWDSYVLVENGLVYPRRSSDREAYHTGNFFEKFTFNDNAKYSDIFFTRYTETEALLAIEIDSEGKRNYVGIYCRDYNAKNNGLRMSVAAGGDTPAEKKQLEYVTDVQGEILASDFNVVGFLYDMANTVLIKKDDTYFIHVMFFDVPSKTLLTIKNNIVLDVSQINGKKKVLGMSTSKIRPHIYFWDDTKVYIYDYEDDEIVELFVSPARKIVAFGVHTKIKNYDYIAPNSVDALFAVGFETGEVEIFEFLRPNLTEVEHGGKYVYKSKENYGKIKQIDYKAGTSGGFWSL